MRSASTLGSLYGIVGNPAAGQDLATRIGYEGAASLANKLTAARAGYLDNIAATAKGRRQVLEVSVTANVNSGPQTLGTITTQACVIESIIIHVDTANASLLTCPVTAAAGVITFISSQLATIDNLNVADK